MIPGFVCRKAPRTVTYALLLAGLVAAPVAACSKANQADLRTRRDGAAKTDPASPAGSPVVVDPAGQTPGTASKDGLLEAAPVSGSLSGYVADADFTPAAESVSVSGTNLTAGTREAIVEEAYAENGTLIRAEIARVSFEGQHFALPKVRGDRYLVVTVDGRAAVLAPLGNTNVGVVVSRATDFAAAFFTRIAATADGLALVSRGVADVAGMRELGTVLRKAVDEFGSASDASILDRLAAELLSANLAVVAVANAAGKDDAALARQQTEAQDLGNGAAVVDQQVAAGSYNERYAARAAAGFLGLETVDGAFTALAKDPGRLGGVEQCARVHTVERILLEFPAEGAQQQKIFAAVGIMPLDTIGKYLAGALAPGAAADALNEALAKVDSGTTGGTGTVDGADGADGADDTGGTDGSTAGTTTTGGETTTTTTGAGGEAPPASHLMFVTASPVAANVNASPSGFDFVCAQRAEAAGLYRAAWKAVYGTATVAAADHVVVTLPINNTRAAGGQQLFAVGALFSPDGLREAAFHDELGAASPSLRVWTGATATGAISQHHCSSWTTAATSTPGSHGYTDGTGRAWLNQGSNYCADPSTHLYCLSQP